ncbi:copper chaperone NosL [Paenibacillus uliginis N3/975]|uniref:Copper chaperone NosL n=1 Tax=Paenibacillus uliginis N3/975 TaxID=1313296 RepID=A0A1X7G8X4_9BACL|nr:nitrous oxide reductase accessory protein NosL [Paenibacillus uliginis]SMF66065.1 copper chaperone NosL [Paenibacillus uliginis N3/975]
MKKMLTIITLCLTIAISAGCGKEEYKAADIDENVDKCEVCQMQVGDNEYAVQIQLKDKKTLKFDDLGDLFLWKQKNGTEQIGAQFVRDYHTKAWILLENATYIYDKSIRTPMAYGVISFAEKADAEKFVSEQGSGQIMTSENLDGHKWESDKEMMKKMHGDQKHDDGNMDHEGEAHEDQEHEGKDDSPGHKEHK